MSKVYNAGYVTAYGAAVRGGYRGTYEEFCEQQADFAQNAQRVASDRAAVERTSASVQTLAAEVSAAAATAISDIQSEGAANVGAVQAKGEEVLASIPYEYSELSAEVDNLESALAPEFSAETDYRVGEVVLYNGKVYRFTSNHSAGAWVSGDVEATTATGGWNDLVPLALAQSKTKALIGTAESHIDLNDIVTVGNYRITKLEYAKLVDNLPGDSPQAGRLTVMLTTSGQIMQFYIMQVSSGNVIYFRNKTSSSWTPWQKILTDLRMDAVPTANSTYPVSSGGVYNAINNLRVAEGTAW